jgi:Tol biopolymer transport system component
MTYSLRWRLFPGLLLCAGLVLPAASAGPQKEQQPKLLLEEAGKKELVDGDLKGAIEIYQKILALEDVPRASVARALLHLGQCYEKLGSTEARKAYERLVREFADQSEETTAARARLAALGGQDTAMRVRQVWAGPQDDLLGAPTRDGRYLTCQDWPSENVAVRDLATGQKRMLTSKAKGSLEFAMLSVPSPDGKQVAYSWYNADGFYDLRVVGMDGSNLRVLYASRELTYVYPSDWSLDGRHVLAVFDRRDKPSQIVLVSVPDGSVRVLKSFDKTSPGRARFSPDGRYIAYHFNQQPGSTAQDISVFAVDGGRETAVVRHPANDVLFDWTPDGKRLLFGSDRSGTMGVWWIQIADGQPMGTPDLVKPDLGQDVRPLGFTRGGSFYYEVRTGLSDVYIAEVNFASGRVLAPPILATERFAGSNSRPDWSRDGLKLAYLSHRGPGVWGARAICVRDTATGEVREISSKLERVISIRWFPDGQSLLAAAQGPSGDYGPFRIDVQNGEFERVDLTRPAPMGIMGAAWSADGKTFYYVRWGPAAKASSVVARDLATGQERQLHSVIEPSVYQSGVSISPDGQRLAVVVRDKEGGPVRHVTVVPTAGGEARDVLGSTELLWPVSIAWAPDGQSVLFVKQPEARNSKTELWLVPVHGGEPRKLDLSAPNMRELSVHPDGRRIAFTAGGDRSEVWVMENFLLRAK